MSHKTEDEILNIVRAFENGTIKRADWRHAEHLTVAVYYAFHHDFDQALIKMRGGIFKLLRCFEIDLSKEMPYHETLTVFWMRTIFDLLERENGDSSIVTANKISEMCSDKDLPLKFYSRERLFSEEARKNYLSPDLQS